MKNNIKKKYNKTKQKSSSGSKNKLLTKTGLYFINQIREI